MVCDPKRSTQVSSLPVCQSYLVSWSFGVSQSCPAPLFLAGLAAVPPWLAAGLPHSFPVMGSWQPGTIDTSLVRGSGWETWQQTAMPSTSGVQQSSGGMEHHHYLLLPKYFDGSCRHRRVPWPECRLEGKRETRWD